MIELFVEVLHKNFFHCGNSSRGGLLHCGDFSLLCFKTQKKEQTDRTYGLEGVLVSSSAAVESSAVWGGWGEDRWDSGGLEAGLPVSELCGVGVLLPCVGLGKEAEETGVLAVWGEEIAGGVGETAGMSAEEDSTSGWFWLDERRPFLPSCSLAAIFLLSLRRWGEESSTSPSSYLRAVCNTHTDWSNSHFLSMTSSFSLVCLLPRR